MTSETGAVWTIQTVPRVKAWVSLTYGGGVFVAVATTDKAMTSPDGVTWQYRSGAMSGGWSSVTYCGGVFAAVASTASALQSTANYMTSADLGVTWTLRDSGLSATWMSITCGGTPGSGGKFVAVATSDKIAYSLV